MIFLKTTEETKLIRESGRILAFVLKKIKSGVAEGVKLLELDNLAFRLAKEYGGRPAFLGYQPDGAKNPYPASICTSLNDVVVHGIPTNRKLSSGDILKIDMGIIYKGFYSDSALTVGVGKISSIAKKLISSTKKALDKAIAQVKPGKTLGDVGWAVENQAKKDGFSVLKQLTGHGVGFELHEDPVILNYGTKDLGIKLKPGMVLAIEPMFSLTSEKIIQNNDESYSSYDRSLTAHFEHTVIVKEKGNEIATIAD